MRYITVRMGNAIRGSHVTDARYRQLEVNLIVDTVGKLQRRISERFPDRHLGGAGARRSVSLAAVLGGTRLL